MSDNSETITFHDALKILNIEDYGERIWRSNSHGELFHLADYITLAEWCKDAEHPEKFRDFFVSIVEDAEKTWERPESVFQHIIRIIEEILIAEPEEDK